MLMGSLGFVEVLLIAIVVLLLFGAKRLPEIGSAFGKAIREFRQAMKGEKPDDEVNKKT